MSPTIEVEDAAGVRRIWFNRPRVHNAQNVEMLELLDTVLDDTARDAAVRVVVLGGRGPSFCSGHDLREMAENPTYAERASTAEGRFRQELDLFVTPVRKVLELPMPVVCRVQGHCLAAGLMFVSAADLVVASDDARFGSSIIGALAVNDAEVPGFAWIVGERRAKQALWLSESLTADEAERAGLVNWVVEPDALDAKVDDVARRLCEQPPEALALSKRTFGFLADRRGRADYFEYHYVAHQLSHHTAEARALLAQRVARVEEGGSPVTDRHRV